MVFKKPQVVFICQKRQINYILNSSINSPYLNEHILKYKHVMLELKDAAVNKQMGLVNTLNDVGGETPVSAVLNSLTVQTANTQAFIEYLTKLNNLLAIRHKIGMDSHQKAAEILNSSFISNNECVSVYKQGIEYNPQIFPDIVYPYLDNASYQYVSLLCDCCDINTPLTALVLSKSVCLAIGVSVFVSMFENYMDFGGIKKSLLILKDKLFYRITYLRIRPYINFQNFCAVSITTIIVGGITFNFFKHNDLKITAEVVNETSVEVAKVGAREVIKDGLKGVINNYEPTGYAGIAVDVTQDFFGRLGYGVVRIVSAPLRGAYVAGFKPVIDTLISIFEKKN